MLPDQQCCIVPVLAVVEHADDPSLPQVVVPANPAGTEDGGLYPIDVLDPDVYLPLNVRTGAALRWLSASSSCLMKNVPP